MRRPMTPNLGRAFAAGRLGFMMAPTLQRQFKSSRPFRHPDMQRPVQRVNPSLGHICSGEPHERCPNAPKRQQQHEQ